MHRSSPPRLTGDGPPPRSFANPFWSLVTTVPSGSLCITGKRNSKAYTSCVDECSTLLLCQKACGIGKGPLLYVHTPASVNRRVECSAVGRLRVVVRLRTLCLSLSSPGVTFLVCFPSLHTANSLKCNSLQYVSVMPSPTPTPPFASTCRRWL